MKKLLLALVAALMLSACISCQTFKPAEPIQIKESDYKAYIKTIQIEVLYQENGKDASKTYNEYCIYIGNEETEAYDAILYKSQVYVLFQFVHPPEYIEDLNFKPEKKWYAFFLDTRDGTYMAASLLTDRVWSSIPNITKHVITAFGVDNEDLLYISINAISGSVTVLFDPKYDKNLKFYNQMLERFREYLQSHDIEQDIPLSLILTKVI